MTAHRVELGSLTRRQKTAALLISPFVPLIVTGFLIQTAVREAWRAFMDTPAGDGVGGAAIDEEAP